MGIRIGKYDFEGLHTSTDNIKNKAGVYVIVCKTPPFYSVIDCGESAAIKKRLKIMTEKSVGLKSAPEHWCLLFLYFGS